MFISCAATLQFRTGIKGHFQPKMQSEYTHKTTVNNSNFLLLVLYLQQGIIHKILALVLVSRCKTDIGLTLTVLTKILLAGKYKQRRILDTSLQLVIATALKNMVNFHLVINIRNVRDYFLGNMDQLKSCVSSGNSSQNFRLKFF